MENTAFEALMIGVNVFVFIIALSAGVVLMSNILDMAEYANQTAITGMNGTLAESIGEVEVRLYTGEQVLAYYKNNNNKYNLYIKSSSGASETALSTYINGQSIYNYMDKQFELQYKGVIGGKDTYVFVSYT